MGADGHKYVPLVLGDENNIPHIVVVVANSDGGGWMGAIVYMNKRSIYLIGVDEPDFAALTLRYVCEELCARGWGTEVIFVNCNLFCVVLTSYKQVKEYYVMNTTPSNLGPDLCMIVKTFIESGPGGHSNRMDGQIRTRGDAMRGEVGDIISDYIATTTRTPPPPPSPPLTGSTEMVEWSVLDRVDPPAPAALAVGVKLREKSLTNNRRTSGRNR